MITNATGIVTTMIAAAAATNRARGRFAPRKSSTGGRSSATATVRMAPTTRRAGTMIRNALEPTERRFQYAVITLRPSLVHAAHDRVQRRHDRHGVGNQVSRHEKPDQLEVQEAGVVDAQPERLVRPVAEGVAGVLAAGPFDGAVGAARARAQEARKARHDGPVRHLVEALVDDPEALADLIHPEQVARQRVALAARRDLELQLRVDAVRMSAADVERDAGRPEVRPGGTHPEGRLAVQDAQPASAPDEDLVLVEEAHSGLQLGARPAHPVAQAAHELVVQVAVDTADPEVVEEELGAGDRGEDLHDLVALGEAPQDGRDPAQVQGVPAHEEHVAGDPVQLAGQDPDVLRPPRDLDVQQLLEGHHRAPLAEEGGDVLQRVELADDVVEVGVLGDLLHAAMEVAQDRVQVHYLLAGDLEDNPQDAVRGRVLGPHVQEHLAVPEVVELPLSLGSGQRDRLEDPGVLDRDRERGIVEAWARGGGHRHSVG